MNRKSKSRPSKRKNEMESSNTSEPNSKRTSKKSESEQKVDEYCWLCHTEADDKICVTCHRAYHSSCLENASASFNELGVCPECQFSSVGGTELNSNRYLNLDKLKKMLDRLTKRSFEKNREKNEIFFCWPEEDRDNLFKIRDFEILLDNINNVLPYTTTAEFYGDVKFIHHNACIAYGADSHQAKAAENLRKVFETELLDLEECPECYYYMHCDENESQDPFVRLCDTPHDIVWAQLSGHPYWPAKCLKVVRGKESCVRFFGKHERSKIPISKCFFLSVSHPKDKNSNIINGTNSGPKKQSYQSAKAELLEYIKLYTRKYGNFPFYPYKTPYKPYEKQNEVVTLSTEGSSNRNLIRMKLEGNVNEDTEICIVNATINVDSEDNITYEDSVTNDIPAPNGSGTEGQCPTLAQINPSINPSSSPCQGSETEGQYPTFAQLNPSFNPSWAATQDNLNKNPSAVTSINMTFSTDENNFNRVNANPVVTSIAYLPPTDTVSNVLSSPSESGLLCCGNTGFSHPSDPEEVEAVHGMIVSNNGTNNSLVQSNSLHNIVNNFPIYTGNELELEEDVRFLRQEKNSTASSKHFNPDLILPVLTQRDPDLKRLVRRSRYFSDANVVQLYASHASTSCSRLAEVCAESRKNKSELRKALEKIERQASIIQQMSNNMNKIETKLNLLESEKHNLKQNLSEATRNARGVIKTLRKVCTERAEKSLKAQFLPSLNEKEDFLLKKDKIIQDKDDIIKILHEEKQSLMTERAEDKQKISELQNSDTISEYKRSHYCCVCERSAAFVCCLNTSYCGPECQKKHAEKHMKYCKKVTSQSFVEQRVISKQSLLMVSHGEILSSGSSAVSNSNNSEASEIDSVSSSAHPKKTLLHRASTSALLPTPRHHSMSSSSRPHFSKNKRHK